MSALTALTPLVGMASALDLWLWYGRLAAAQSQRLGYLGPLQRALIASAWGVFVLLLVAFIPIYLYRIGMLAWRLAWWLAIGFIVAGHRQRFGAWRAQRDERKADLMIARARTQKVVIAAAAQKALPAPSTFVSGPDGTVREVVNNPDGSQLVRPLMEAR